MARCIYFKAIIYSPSHAQLARLRCKSWSCEYCSNVNRKQWRKLLYDYINSHEEINWSFHTFTLKPHYRKLPLKRAIDFVKKQWQPLLQALNRLYGHFEYVRVVEFHQDGTPHLHVLAGLKIPDNDLSKSNNRDKTYIKKLKHKYVVETKNGQKREYKSVLSRLGYGYITNSQNAIGIPSKTVSYITKYMTKVDSTTESLAKREKLRIIQTSRGIKKTKPVDDEKQWQVRRYVDYADYSVNEEIFDLNRKITTTRYDLDESWHYPPDKEYLD